MPTASDNIALIINGIEAKYGKSASDIVATYLPTLYTMGLQEIIALADTVNSGNSLAAQSAIQSAMTPDQLAAQKVLLAQLTERMASENAATKAFWNSFVAAGIKIAITSLLPVVLI